MSTEELRRRIEEELSDADTYERMAEEDSEHDGIYRDIAREERCHARHLEYILSHTSPE